MLSIEVTLVCAVFIKFSFDVVSFWGVVFVLHDGLASFDSRFPCVVMGGSGMDVEGRLPYGRLTRVGSFFFCASTIIVDSCYFWRRLLSLWRTSTFSLASSITCAFLVFPLDLSLVVGYGISVSLGFWLEPPPR